VHGLAEEPKLIGTAAVVGKFLRDNFSREGKEKMAWGVGVTHCQENQANQSKFL
jgi:hypothetical protein